MRLSFILCVFLAGSLAVSCVKPNSNSEDISLSLYQGMEDRLDAADYIGVIQPLVMENCPGAECIGSISIPDCSCPFGVRFTYAEVERIAGVAPPDIVSGNRMLPEVLAFLSGDSPVDGVVIAGSIELPSAATNNICELPESVPFLQADVEGTGPVGYAFLKGDRAYGESCVTATIQRIHRGLTTEQDARRDADAICWKRREETLADLRSSATRRATRGPGSVSPEPTFTEPHVDRGPYWCRVDTGVQGSSGTASSSGGG